MKDNLSAERTRWNIDVLPADIERAMVSDSYKCVVAQAIKRTIPDATGLIVDIQTIRFSRLGKRYVYLTPYTVQGYIVAFDAGDAIAPFSFHLRSPATMKQLKKVTITQAVPNLDLSKSNAIRRETLPSNTKEQTPTDSEEVNPKDHFQETIKRQWVGNGPQRIPVRSRTRYYGIRGLRYNQSAIEE